MLVLSKADIATALDLPAELAAIEAGFAAYTRGHIEAPLRQRLDVPAVGGIVLVMPCANHDAPALGVKVINVFPRNPDRRLARLLGVYLLFEYETGQPLALMDGTYITAVRTAAVSAVATRYLARSDAATLGIFGTGVQAEQHALALPRVRPVQRILVHGSSPEKGQAFAERVEPAVGIPVEAAPSARETVTQCDLLVTATTANAPLFSGEDVRPGTHVNAVGAFTPDARELDATTIRRAHVVVDTYEGALGEAGDILIPLGAGEITREHVAAELGEIVLGRATGRASPESITVFESVGAAFEDVVTARLAYERATSLSLGHTFDL